MGIQTGKSCGPEGPGGLKDKETRIRVCSLDYLHTYRVFDTFLGAAHFVYNIESINLKSIFIPRSQFKDLTPVNCTHHTDGSDRHEAVAPVAVGPGVPAGILALLQDEHLTIHVLLLITHPAGWRVKKRERVG